MSVLTNVYTCHIVIGTTSTAPVTEDFGHPGLWVLVANRAAVPVYVNVLGNAASTADYELESSGQFVFNSPEHRIVIPGISLEATETGA